MKSSNALYTLHNTALTGFRTDKNRSDSAEFFGKRPVTYPESTKFLKRWLGNRLNYFHFGHGKCQIA